MLHEFCAKLKTHLLEFSHFGVNPFPRRRQFFRENGSFFQRFNGIFFKDFSVAEVF